MHPKIDGNRGRPPTATILALLALLVSVSGVAVAAIPATGDGTITACYDKEAALADNKKGTLRVIDAEAGQTCTAKETTLSWKDGSTLLGKTEKAADSEKLDGLDSSSYARFGGRVSRDGTHASGSGFSAEKTSTGQYLLRFPPGTFDGCHTPFITVTPFAFVDIVTPTVVGLTCGGNGGATVAVKFTDRTGAPTDSAFMFVAM